MELQAAERIDWAVRGARLLGAKVSHLAADAVAVAKQFPVIEDVVVRTIPGKEGSYRTAAVPAKQVLQVVQTPNPRAEAALKGSQTIAVASTAVAVAGTVWDGYRFKQAHDANNKTAMGAYGLALAGDAVALAGQALIKKDPETAAISLVVGHVVSAIAGVLGNVAMDQKK